MTVRLRPALVQILGYAGAAVALAAAAGAFADRHDEAGVRVGLDAGAALVLLVAGWFAGDRDDPAWSRMRSVFWFGAVFAWADLAKVAFGSEGADLDGRSLALAVSLATSVVAVALWWVERRSLQAIAAFLSVHAVVVSLTYAERSLLFVGDVPNPTPPAIGTWIFGLAVVAAGAKGWLAPRRTAIVLGSIAAIAGAALIEVSVVSGPATIGILLALATSVLVLLVGERSGLVAVTGIGIVGILAGAAALVGEHVDSLGPGIAVLVIGLAMLAAAVVLARRGT